MECNKWGIWLWANGNAEALLVVPSLGVQLRKTRRNGATFTKVLAGQSYLSPRVVTAVGSLVRLVRFQFVDARAICAVVIHEAITFADVPYLLAFMVDGQEDNMLLAFEVDRGC